MSHLLECGWCHDREGGRALGAALISARMLVHAVRATDPFKDKDHSFYALTDRVDRKEGVIGSTMGKINQKRKKIALRSARKNGVQLS